MHWVQKGPSQPIRHLKIKLITFSIVGLTTRIHLNLIKLHNNGHFTTNLDLVSAIWSNTRKMNESKVPGEEIRPTRSVLKVAHSGPPLGINSIEGR